MMQTLLITIMTLSVVLQFIAAILALRLIRISGATTAWALISGAIMVQAVRRVIAIMHPLNIGDPSDTDVILGLVISALLAIGIILIKPLFEKIHRAKQDLLDYQASLKEKNMALEEEISRRERVEIENRLLNKELEQRVVERTSQLKAANQEMKSFAYSVSHDLRSPLRSIDGFSLALLEDYEDKLDEKGKDYLQRVRAATQRMAQLIDDILKLSRITRSELTFETVNLSDLVVLIADELRSENPERKAEFVIKKGVTTNGDPRLLKVALDNLLGNAWKFTRRHAEARIEFGVTDVDGKTAYFVRDDGAGFDMKYADKLFTTFQRLHTEQEFPGTGVGLALVQHIIHRHGGVVWAEGAVEQGATIYFTL